MKGVFVAKGIIKVMIKLVLNVKSLVNNVNKINQAVHHAFKEQFYSNLCAFVKKVFGTLMFHNVWNVV